MKKQEKVKKTIKIQFEKDDLFCVFLKNYSPFCILFCLTSRADPRRDKKRAQRAKRTWRTVLFPNRISGGYTAFSEVMATVISLASRQAASIFSFKGCTTISPGVRIIFFRLDRGFPSAYTVR